MRICTFFLLVVKVMTTEDMTTVAYVGDNTLIACVIQESYILPSWKGPPYPTLTGTIYTQQGNPEFNPSLGEKLTRLSYADNQRDLKLKGVLISDSGTYQCLLNNGRVQGNTTLEVRIRPEQLEISASVPITNNSARATEGLAVTVTCFSRGGYPVPTVAWYWESTAGQPVVEINMGIQTGNSFIVTLPYTFTPTRMDDRRQLVCRSYWPTPTDSQGSLETFVTLFLDLKPLQPYVTQKTSVVAGNDVIVECRTNGSRPAANISWAYRGHTYTPNVTVTDDTATQTFDTLSVLRRNVTAADNGQMVVCSVSHRALDDILTASASLNVQFSPERSSIITGNILIVANSVNSLSLVCTTGSSNPPAFITWRNGTDIIQNNVGYNATSGANNGTIRSQTLLLIPTRFDHGKNISCITNSTVSQFSDTTSVTLNLTFKPIVSISTTSTITLTEQTSQVPVELPCSVDSNPPSEITWYHNSRAVTLGTIGSSLSYTIREANRSSYGKYTCTADNNVPPTDSKTYTVDVLFRPLEVSIEKPTGSVIADGQNIMSIKCTSGTSNPVSNITWATENIPTSQPSHVDSPGEYGGTVQTSTIYFYPTRDHDGATFRCAARNNVTGQQEVFESTVIDNIIYSPKITNIPDRNVTEGDNVRISCYASSKPPASFTWNKGSFRVTHGNGTVNFNGISYSLQNVSRTQAGKYNCTADNHVGSSDSKQTELIVLYPPDVTVNAINTTVNSGSTNVTCEASGVPDQYIYETWVHTWNGDVVTHPVQLPARRVLTLTYLTYAHSGVYTCGVSNGIKGISQGAGTLLVKSPPIVVGDVANTLEIKASGQLMKATTVTFQFYSNAGQGFVTVQKTNGTGEHVVDVQLRDVAIRLPVFLSEVNTTGTEATINVILEKMNQFGRYDIFLKNEMDKRIHLSLIISPLGPPEPPELINITILDHQSVIIMWLSGFPNGLNQTFVIQLSTDNSTWWNITQYGGLAYQHTHSKTIEDLTNSQLYYVRMFSFNAEGKSENTGIFSFKTEALPESLTTSLIGLIAGGAAGGVVASAVIVVLIIVIVWRRKAARMPGSAKDKGSLVMSSNHNEGYDNGDEEVINRLYESAGVTETVAGASTSIQVSSADVENIYAKVNKKPGVVYAMPDKRKDLIDVPDISKGKKMERQLNLKAIKSQEGDVYENAPSISSGKIPAPLLGESVYESTSISTPAASKKPRGADGLLYADLEFAPRKKGQTKIIGTEDKCEYTTIDLTKKAQPLPDSDDENNTHT